MEFWGDCSRKRRVARSGTSTALVLSQDVPLIPSFETGTIRSTWSYLCEDTHLKWHYICHEAERSYCWRFCWLSSLCRTPRPTIHRHYKSHQTIINTSIHIGWNWLHELCRGRLLILTIIAIHELILVQPFVMPRTSQSHWPTDWSSFEFFQLASHRSILWPRFYVTNSTTTSTPLHRGLRESHKSAFCIPLQPASIVRLHLWLEIVNRDVVSLHHASEAVGLPLVSWWIHFTPHTFTLHTSQLELELELEPQAYVVEGLKYRSWPVRHHSQISHPTGLTIEFPPWHKRSCFWCISMHHSAPRYGSFQSCSFSCTSAFS